MKGLDCKETVVRRRRGSETGTFGIKQIGMAQISTIRNVSLVIFLWWKFEHCYHCYVFLAHACSSCLIIM